MYLSIHSFLVLLLASVVAADKYIIVLKSGQGGLLSSIIQGVLGGALDPLHQFTSGSFSGFNADLTPVQVALLKANPNVSLCHNAISLSFSISRSKDSVFLLFA